MTTVKDAAPTLDVPRDASPPQAHHWQPHVRLRRIRVLALTALVAAVAVVVVFPAARMRQSPPRPATALGSALVVEWREGTRAHGLGVLISEVKCQPGETLDRDEAEVRDLLGPPNVSVDPEAGAVRVIGLGRSPDASVLALAECWRINS